MSQVIFTLENIERGLHYFYLSDETASFLNEVKTTKPRRLVGEWDEGNKLNLHNDTVHWLFFMLASYCSLATT